MEAMPFVRALIRLSGAMETYLEEHEESPVRKEILDFYFEVSHFLLINDRLDSNYVVYFQRLFCLSGTIKGCLGPKRETMRCMPVLYLMPEGEGCLLQMT